MDFAACLKSATTNAHQAIAVRFAEACLRLRAGLKLCAAEIFRALDLRASTEYHRVWPTLLALEHTDSPATLMRVKGKGKGKGEVEAVLESGTPPKTTLKSLPAVGPQLLTALLRFPADAVQPLNSGLPKFMENREVLLALAREAKTARVLEGALAPASALLPKLRARLARAFKGALGELGPHPVGGWVCAALWRASLGETALREAFAKELLDVEEALRAHNFAVWKVCGLHQAKVRQEEWSQQQEKAGKAKRLFDSILEDADPEAAKVAAHARVRAAEDAADREALQDPTVAGLLPAELPGATDGTKEDSKEKANGEDDEDDGGSDEELDQLMKLSSRQRRFKRKNGKQDNAAEDSGPSKGSRGGVALKPTVGDPSLLETLELISGKAPAKIRKRQKRAAVADAGSDSEEDANAGTSSTVAPQEEVNAGKRKKKKKRQKTSSM